jgi:ribosomal protein S8
MDNCRIKLSITCLKNHGYISKLDFFNNKLLSYHGYEKCMDNCRIKLSITCLKNHGYISKLDF